MGSSYSLLHRVCGSGCIRGIMCIIPMGAHGMYYIHRSIHCTNDTIHGPRDPSTDLVPIIANMILHTIGYISTAWITG